MVENWNGARLMVRGFGLSQAVAYFTAWPDLEKADRIFWMPDIYGRDEPEWKAITEASAPKPKSESPSLAKIQSTEAP